MPSILCNSLHGTATTAPRHFDAHALRTEDMDGVWAFARACMRTFLILQEKVDEFDQDRTIKGLIDQMDVAGPGGQQRRIGDQSARRYFASDHT